MPAQKHVNRRKGKEINLKNHLRGIGFYVILFLIIMMIFVMTSFPQNQTQYIYSDLVTMVKSGQVKEIQIVDTLAYVTLGDNTKHEIAIPGYYALYESAGKEIEEQVAQGVLKIDTPEPVSPPWWLSILPSLGLIVIMVVFWFFFMQQSQGGGRGVMSFGKSKAKVTTDEKGRKTFDDVAGADEEKEELEEQKKELEDKVTFIEKLEKYEPVSGDFTNYENITAAYVPRDFTLKEKYEEYEAVGYRYENEADGLVYDVYVSLNDGLAVHTDKDKNNVENIKVSGRDAYLIAGENEGKPYSTLIITGNKITVTVYGQLTREEIIKVGESLKEE